MDLLVDLNFIRVSDQQLVIDPAIAPQINIKTVQFVRLVKGMRQYSENSKYTSFCPTTGLV